MITSSTLQFLFAAALVLRSRAGQMIVQKRGALLIQRAAALAAARDTFSSGANYRLPAIRHLHDECA